MNKKFLQNAAVAMGLTALSLSLAACNVNPSNRTPRGTGIIDREIRNDMPYSDTGYQRIHNTGLNNRVNRFATPVPGNVKTGITPLPGITPGPNTNNITMTDMQTKSLNIERQLESLANVKDASVMVVGNTALVACNPASTGVDMTTLRNSITQKVKSVDPSITNVVITESADVRTSIQQLFSNMNNKSINQITQEFNKLIRDITPTLS